MARRSTTSAALLRRRRASGVLGGPSITGAGSLDVETYKIGTLHTITAGTADATGGGTVSYEYRWRVASSTVASVAGYTPVGADDTKAIEAQWRAVETGGTNDGATAWQTVDSGGTVTWPVVSIATVTIAGVAGVGHTLTAGGGAITGGGYDAPVFVFKLVSDDSELKRSTSNTYVNTAGIIADQVYVTKEVTNSGGTTTADSAANGTNIAQLTLGFTGTYTSNTQYPTAHARIGDHASIGLAMSNGGSISSRQYGSTSGGAQFGTATNPNAFASVDTGNPASPGTLYGRAVYDGVTYNTSITARQPEPVAAGVLDDLVFSPGITITPVDLSTDWTGGGLTFALLSGTLPGTLSVSAAALLSGTTPASPAAATSIVVRGTSTGGVADSGFDVTITDVAELTAFSVGSQSGGNAPCSYTISADSDCDLVVVATGSAAPTATQIRAGTDGDDVAAADYGTVSLTVSGSSINFALASTLDGTYDFYIVPAGSSAVSSDTSIALDTTVPGLSSPSGTQTGETTADLSIATDETQGTVYVGIYAAATAAPSAATLIAGTGFVYAANDATPTNPTTFSATGLTAGTDYKAHFVQVDEQGNTSGVASSATFTTAAGSLIDFSAIPDNYAAGTPSTVTGGVRMTQDGGTLMSWTWAAALTGGQQYHITGDVVFSGALATNALVRGGTSITATDGSLFSLNSGTEGWVLDGSTLNAVDELFTPGSSGTYYFGARVDTSVGAGGWCDFLNFNLVAA